MENNAEIDWAKEDKKIPFVILGVMIFMVLLAFAMYHLRHFLYG